MEVQNEEPINVQDDSVFHMDVVKSKKVYTIFYVKD